MIFVFLEQISCSDGVILVDSQANIVIWETLPEHDFIDFDDFFVFLDTFPWLEGDKNEGSQAYSVFSESLQEHVFVILSLFEWFYDFGPKSMVVSLGSGCRLALRPWILWSQKHDFIDFDDFRVFGRYFIKISCSEHLLSLGSQAYPVFW